MTRSLTRRVSVERTITAPADRIFAALTDPATHAVIDGSGTLLPVAGPTADPLRSGSVFVTPMSRRLRAPTRGDLVQVGVAILVRGRMRNTVVEFDQDRRVAWRNFGRHVWRFELTPLGDGAVSSTRVRETFDYATNLVPWLLEWAGFPARNTQAMNETLQTLDELITAHST